MLIYALVVLSLGIALHIRAVQVRRKDLLDPDATSKTGNTILLTFTATWMILFGIFHTVTHYLELFKLI